MGPIASSEQYTARSSAPDFRALLALSATISEQAVPQLVRKTRERSAFTLTDVAELFTGARAEDVELAFRLLDSPERGIVGASELVGVLLLLAPQLPAEVKLRGIFQTFNVSTHRQGELVADEATLLFRSLAGALLKAAATDIDALPSLSVFESLSKTAYADRETLTPDEFAQVCQATRQIVDAAGRWLGPEAPPIEKGVGL